jgi:hypothetical protein
MLLQALISCHKRTRSGVQRFLYIAGSSIAVSRLDIGIYLHSCACGVEAALN